MALCEDWANYIGTWTMPDKYLSYYQPRSGFPYDYQKMSDELAKSGCSIANLEKCLTVKTFSEYKNLLTAVYASDTSLKSKITSIVDRYYLMN